MDETKDIDSEEDSANGNHRYSLSSSTAPNAPSPTSNPWSANNRGIKQFMGDVQFMRSFILNYDKAQPHRLDKVWISRCREIICDAEDLLDVIYIRDLHKKVMSDNTSKRLLPSKSNHLSFIIRTLTDFKDIRERINNFSKDIEPYFTIRPVEVNRRETDSFVKGENVIGRDQEKEDIIKLLLSADHGGEETRRRFSIPVVSIIGFEGLGKTTLAHLVYSDARVRGGFKMCLWACVSHVRNIEEILLKILEPFPESIPRELHQLALKLRQEFEGKTVLLVLDDVQFGDNGSTWDYLQLLLRCCGRGSKVLLTTRETKVAVSFDAIQPYYQLNVLSEDSAWALLKSLAFREDEVENHPELESLGREIARKCGYYPPTLKHVSSSLRHKEKDKKTWLHFVHNELPELLPRDPDSYDMLPEHLKRCFSYCSLFPKCYTFDKDELIRMWLAQGFIRPFPRSKEFLEKIGEECFAYLVNRYFFQNGEDYTRNGSFGCRFKIHSLMHDLSIQVARREHKCFFEDDLKDMDDKSGLLHISINNPYPLFDCSSLPSCLRTLLFHNAKQLRPEILSLVMKRFRVLRTLQLSHLNLDTLPDSIGDLIHLRYLNLSYNWNLETLPNSICNLYLLQTLNLEGCVSLKELSSNFTLLSLRHLFLEKCIGLSYLPSGLGALTSLVTLDRLIVNDLYGGLRYLKNLNNLRGVLTIELPLEGWPNCVEDATESRMSDKKGLYGMNIRWIKSEAGTAGIVKENEAKEVLEAFVPNGELTFLNIDGYVGDALPIYYLVTKHLQELVLTDCSFEYIVFGTPKSPMWARLKTIKLTSLTGFKGWEFEPGWYYDNISRPSFPGVSEVVIENCPELTENVPLLEGAENMQLLGVNVKLVEGLLTANGSSTTSSSASTSECQYNSKLVELQLYRVDGLSCLHHDMMKHLTRLKTLSISGCSQLEKVSSGGLACLTALEILSIFDCGAVNLEDSNVSELPWKMLQRLRDLTVPWQRHLQQGLQYLTGLERLEIHYCESDQVEMDNRAKGMFGKGLERLGRLKIKFGGGTSCFPRWIQDLCFLEELEFCDCKELSLSWTTLINMEKILKLDFIKVKNVIMADEVVVGEQDQLKSLEEMHIYESEKEEWILNTPWKFFPSLKILSLSAIPNLNSLPSGIQHLSSLNRLTIGDCSERLKNRCKRKGEDWHLISRITDVDIRCSGNVEAPEIFKAGYNGGTYP